MRSGLKQLSLSPRLRYIADSRLELVAEPKLHYAGCTLNADKVCPRGWGSPVQPGWVQSQPVATATAGNATHMLCVGHIERVPANLELVIFAPG